MIDDTRGLDWFDRTYKNDPVTWFDSLSKRDLENGAVLDTIRQLLRSYQNLRPAAADVLELLLDEYDGAPDSGNLHWGRHLDALETALGLNENPLR